MKTLPAFVLDREGIKRDDSQMLGSVLGKGREYIIVIPAWGACVRLHRLLLVRLKTAKHSVFCWIYLTSFPLHPCRVRKQVSVHTFSSDLHVAVGLVNSFFFGSLCSLALRSSLSMDVFFNPLRLLHRVTNCFWFGLRSRLGPLLLSPFGSLFALGSLSSLLRWTKGHFTPALR